jgi:hypothetical protein
VGYSSTAYPYKVSSTASYPTSEAEKKELPVSESLQFLFDEFEDLRARLRKHGYAPSERNIDLLLKNTKFYEKIQEAVEEVRKAKFLLESTVALEK